MSIVTVPESAITWLRYDAHAKRWWLAVDSDCGSELLRMVMHANCDGVRKTPWAGEWSARSRKPGIGDGFGASPMEALRKVCRSPPALPPLPKL